MLISKFTGKNTGKTYVSITLKNSEIQETKNPEYKRIVLWVDNIIGLDDKKQCKFSDIVNVDKLANNTK